MLVGRAVGAGDDPSSHADSKAAASKHTQPSPIHIIGRMDCPNTLPTGDVNANCCLLFSLAAKPVDLS